jgi:signal transduction histidine kinase
MTALPWYFPHGMKLRTLILLFLFLFGLTPLIAAAIINVPLILSKLEHFYHKAHLQNLRADFRDLDQHLASRHDLIRLLAKLPEASAVLGYTEDTGLTMEEARERYLHWANRVLADQVDIVQILFLTPDGRAQFWLERDSENLAWVSTDELKDYPSEDFIEASRHLAPGGVLIGPISLNPRAGALDRRRFMNLRLISPVTGSTDNQPAGLPVNAPGPGLVVMNIDVGGLARAYRDTLWVHNDGRFLEHTTGDQHMGTAFEQFPGLEELFAKGDLALWKHGNQQILWVPLFVTEHSGPLWVGRRVDPSPITDFTRALELRIAGIVLLLIVLVLLGARWIALRIEKFGSELIDGITRVLKDAAPVRFDWRGPREVRTLARNLNELAEVHARHSQSLRAHAKELEATNRYKSEFLANVSHELRTPLNSILLLSKMLAESQLDEKQRKQAQVIHSAGKDLAALIDNILDLSRIEAGKLSFTLERIDLKGLLIGLIELVRPQSDQKGLELKLEVDEDAPSSIVSDDEKIRQIIKNFLSNAVKFTPSGGITVRLQRNTAEDAERRPVRIAVEDSGIGVPGEKHALIFEAFEQADGSTNRRFGGTGLGLTISRELARNMGGRIDLESEEEQGSIFSLLLPLEFDVTQVDADQVASEPEAEEKEAESETIPEADFGNQSVLVVDDDVRNLLALTPLLEAWGLRVTGAGDGVEALETLEEEEFQLILMDIMMPEMDGYETIRRIRAGRHQPQIPIVALTAKAGPEDRQRCLEAGADDYLPKPVDASQLKDTLERFLGAPQ